MGDMGLHAVPDTAETVTIAAAVDETVAALGCPKSDAALVALARRVAATIDAMSVGESCLMLGQTGPLLLRSLQELEARAARRRSAARVGRPNQVAKLRAAHAVATRKRGR